MSVDPDTFENLSIVIPCRIDSSPRIEILEWVTERYSRMFPRAQLIMSDSGGLVFNRSSSRNSGVRQATGEVILLADADTIPYPDFIREGLGLLGEGAPWVIPYGELQYYNSDEQSGGKILALEPDVQVKPEDITWEHKITSWSGQVLMKREDFWSAGGFDERFKGWGYEDNAFKVAADSALGPFQRVLDGWTIHIWHPAPVETTWQQPDIEHNRLLYEETRRR